MCNRGLSFSFLFGSSKNNQSQQNYKIKTKKSVKLSLAQIFNLIFRVNIIAIIINIFITIFIIFVYEYHTYGIQAII